MCHEIKSNNKRRELFRPKPNGTTLMPTDIYPQIQRKTRENLPFAFDFPGEFFRSRQSCDTKDKRLIWPAGSKLGKQIHV